MPHREQLPEEEEVKVFSRDQLTAVLTMTPQRHQPLFELLAATGLRISEAIASDCTSSSTRASPRSASAAPSSATGSCRPRASGRREVRLPEPLAARLRAHLATQTDQDSTALAFPSLRLR
jgi:integrase